MNKVKWGVLGVAKIAVEHLIPAILNASNSELYGIASRDVEKAKTAGEKFGCRAYTGYESLLTDEQIDAVYIPLPNEMHMEWTIAAAKAGKHVLCEKPLGLNVVQCEEMVKACKENNVLLMEAFMYRYSEKTKKILEIIESGQLGEIKHISSSFRFMLTDSSNNRFYPQGGGSLYDVGCYPINFINMITGTDPMEAFALRTDQYGVDVSFAAVLKYEGGLTATIHSGFNSKRFLITEISGTKGVLMVTNPFLDGTKDVVLITEEGEQVFYTKESNRYTKQIEGFADGILYGKELLMPLEDTLRNMKLIDRLYDIAIK